MILLGKVIIKYIDNHFKEKDIMDDNSAIVSKLLSDRLCVGPIKDISEWDENFKSLDSLDMMDILFCVEDHFNIRLREDCQILSFTDLVNQIDEQLKKVVVS
jgi:acyl carrier protein